MIKFGDNLTATHTPHRGCATITSTEGKVTLTLTALRSRKQQGASKPTELAIDYHDGAAPEAFTYDSRSEAERALDQNYQRMLAYLLMRVARVEAAQYV